MAPSNDDSYDIVIVGGGTAGLVLASRLSENPNVQVLVLEAGDDMTDDPRVNTPAMWPMLINSAANWDFRTVPQEHLSGQEIQFSQGRVLGGSSSTNSFIWAPTSQKSIDGWTQHWSPVASDTATESGWNWGWSEFDKFVRKSCTLTTGDTATGDGPIQLSILNDSEPKDKETWTKVWTDTWSNLGYPTADPFSPNAKGAVRNFESIDPVHKQRSGAARAYLTAAVRERENLTVIANATVTKILFHELPPTEEVRSSHSGEHSANVTAHGVQYITKPGDTRVVQARREVILSAGTINSPRILELSGIGGAQLLKNLGIEPVVDNAAVGENLQNHVVIGLSFPLRSGGPHPETLDAFFRQDPAAVAAATQAYGKQTGPLASGGHVTSAQIPLPVEDKAEITEFLRKMNTENSRTDDTLGVFGSAHRKFVSSVLSPQAPGDEEQASATYITLAAYVSVEDWTSRVRPAGDWFSLAVVLSHPLSRGSVHITTADPEQAKGGGGLAIDPRYLSNPLDVEVLARHLRYVEGRLTRTEPLAGLIREDYNKGRFTDLEKAREYVRHTATGAHHHTSTCAMAPASGGGVVDQRLKVHGTTNLRVCDASVIPFAPRANTQAVVYGVAELAAHLIAADLRCD